MDSQYSLGAALISSENTEIFVWLFETWLKCMNGQSPKAIITDQDRAMKSAINIVFPNARHRFCLWHILKKISDKFGSHSQYHAIIKNALRSCVYDSQTCDEFDTSWQSQFLLHSFSHHKIAHLITNYMQNQNPHSKIKNQYQHIKTPSVTLNMGTHGGGELFRLELIDGFIDGSDSDGGWCLTDRFLDGGRCRWRSMGGVRWTMSPHFELCPWVGVADCSAWVPFVAIRQPNNDA